MIQPLLLAALLTIHKGQTSFRSNGKNIHLEVRCLEVRCGLASPPKPAAIIFLHGAGGPHSQGIPYLDEENDFAQQGYCVYIPSYLDATGALADKPHTRYPTWTRLVDDLAQDIENRSGVKQNRIALIGYSLGASVALASAAQNPLYGAVVEFSGSLPDEYLPLVKTFPPLLIVHGRDDVFVPVSNAQQLARLCNLRGLVCKLQILPREGHFLSIGALVNSKHQVEQFIQEHLPLR